MSCMQRSRKPVRRNLWVMASVAFINGFYMGMFLVVQQPFMLELGASMSLIGVLMSIGGRGGILATLVQPFSGSLSDVLGRKPFLLWARMLILGSLLSYLLASLTRNWLFLLPATIFSGLSAMSWPVWDATVVESVGSSKRGMAYSIMMFFSTLPGIFTRPLGGYIADKRGYTPIFVLSAILELSCLLILLLLFRETISSERKKVDLSEVLKSSLIPPRSELKLYLLLALDAFVWGMVISILPGMLTDTYRLTNLELGLMMTVFSAVWTLSQLPVGKLVDKFGPKMLLVLSEVFGIVAMALFLTSPNFVVLLVAQGAWGLCISTWIPSLMSYITSRAEGKGMAGSLGRVNAVRGILSFPAPAVGGILYDRFGLPGPLMPTILGALLVMLLMLEVLK